jgi:hypothetical protein
LNNAGAEALIDERDAREREREREREKRKKDKTGGGQEILLVGA